jgi:hypothetical protein
VAVSRGCGLFGQSDFFWLAPLFSVNGRSVLLVGLTGYRDGRCKNYAKVPEVGENVTVGRGQREDRFLVNGWIADWIVDISHDFRVQSSPWDSDPCGRCRTAASPNQA